jgi:histidinol-phosphatase
MALPAAGEVYWAARGLGAWLSTAGGPPVRLGVSGVAAWADATFLIGEPRLLFAPPLLAGVARLATSCASTRCPGDLAGCALVLKGQADAWVETGVQIWDIAPFPVLVAEAGGRFTDLRGAPGHAAGGCVVTNGKLHAHVVAALGAG